MGVAACAACLGPNHAVAGVLVLHDVFFLRGSVEAWPAGARIKLGCGIEQRRSTANAVIRARIFRLPILSAEGRLGASVPRDAVLLGSQFLLPLGFTLHYFFCHDFLYAVLPEWINKPKLAVALHSMFEHAKSDVSLGRRC